MRLGIDTSGPWLALAVVSDDGDRVHSVLLRAGRRHAELLVPELDALLARTRTSRARLLSVVSGTGPGSYTGLRVGLAAATGIARGLGIPHHGADSLAAAARPLLGPGAEAWVTVDARRGNVYAGRYARRREGVHTVVPPFKLPLSELSARAASDGVAVLPAGAPDAAWLALRYGDGLPPDAVYL